MDILHQKDCCSRMYNLISCLPLEKTFCGNTTREIDVHLPRANKESNKINSWESRGRRGGGACFFFDSRGGFRKIIV